MRRHRTLICIAVEMADVSSAYANSTECAIDPPIGNINRAAWRLAIDLTVAGEHLESTIHSVERIPSERRGASVQLIPTRFASS
jgi:hypothetical protein